MSVAQRGFASTLVCNKTGVCPRPHPPARFRCIVWLGWKRRGLGRHNSFYHQLMEGGTEVAPGGTAEDSGSLNFLSFRARPADPRLAQGWQRTGIILRMVETALLLGQLRSLPRSPDYRELNPIRSLYYFVPLIEEVMQTPPPNGYLVYMKSKLQELAVSRPPSPPAESSRTGA